MKIIIVGKTKMHSDCCIGALCMSTNQSIRLLESDGSVPPRGTGYNIGDVWEINYQPVNNPKPPHNEDVLVSARSFLGKISNVRREILKRCNPHRGHIDGLHNGLIRFTNNGSGFISSTHGVPNYSTCYWISDNELRLIEIRGKYRYIYPDFFL